MRNFNFNWMRNAAKNTQTTGGGTSRRCEDANQSRIASDPIPCRYRVDTVSLPCFGYTPGISGRLMKYAAMIFCMFVLGVGQMWGGDYAVVADWRANTGIGNINAAIGSTGDNVTFSPINKGKALTSTAITNSGNTTNAIAISENYSSSGGNFIDIRVPAGYKIKSVDSIYITSGSTITSRTGVYMCYAASQLIALDAKNTSPGTETTFSLPNVSTGGKCYGGVGFTPSFPGGSSITSADSIRCVRLYKKASSGTNYYVARLKVTVATVSAPAASGKNIYLKPNGIWDKDGARFAAYYWKSSGSGNGWVDFASYNACTPCFKATIPSGYDKVILCRMNGATAVNNWDNSWNQTLDQTVPTGNDTCFTISSINGCTDGKSCGSWGTYTAPTYTISYAANSGSGSMSSQTGIACGTDKATTANAFTRDGYSFTGWHADVDVTVGGANKTAGTLLADGVTIQNVSSNITLTAQWEEEVTYTVTYSLNGGKYNGSSTAPTQAAVASGTEINMPAKVPTKTNYVFGGWTCNIDSKKYAPGQPYTMTSANTTFTAYWISEASMVSGTLYKVEDMIPNTWPLDGSGKMTTTEYGIAGGSANGIFEILGEGYGNDDTGKATPMGGKKASADYDGGPSFTNSLYFKGAGTGSPSGSTLPTARAIKFRIPSAGTLTLYVRYPARIKLIKSGSSAAVLGESTSDKQTIEKDVTAGTWYLYATGGSTTLYGLKFVEEPCSATQPGTISKGTLSACTLRLTAGDSPASNNTWYWQSSEDGEDKTESGATKDVTSTGTYYIRSFCSTGSGCWSDARTVTVSASDLTPAAPSALAASSVTAKGVTLTVTDAANTNDYEFYVSTTDDSDDIDEETTATHSVTSAKSLTITNLYAGTTFYAWARAKCGSYKSAWTALTDDTFETSTVTMTPTLTNVTKSSGATSGIGGSDYTAVFTADEEYSMPNPTVTIGGNAATSGTDYTWSVDGSEGTITIPANKINGNIAITLNSADAAPSSAVISGTYHYFPGDNISLTCTPSGNNGPTTYQWYKGGKSDEDNLIDGATSATYTKNSCAFADAGSYYCKVTCNETSIWAVTNSYENYDVKILRLYVNGSKSGEAYGNVDFTKVDGTTATASISLGSSWTYGFNIADGCGHYYGNAGTMTENNCTGWTTNVNGTDCGLTTTNAATYIFTINYSSLEAIVTSITYPTANQAADKVIYFDNQTVDWSTLHYRIGKSNHTQATAMTKVSGTNNLYKVTTAEYNGFSGWHIANNAGWTGSNSIYRTYTNGDSYSITYATAHEGGAVTDAAVTVTPTTSKGMGGDKDVNDNCTFYNYTLTTGMKTDRVTISDYSHGTITVNYVDTDDEEATLTSGYADLAHSVILTSITAVPNTGYNASAITINGGAYSANYVVTGATTVAATFTAKTTSLTLKTGAQGSGEDKTGITATFDSGTLTGLAAVHSATGYNLDGYYTAGGVKVLDNTGALVHTATDYTTSGGLWKCVEANLTLTAHWTAKTTTITIDANTANLGSTTPGSVTATYASALPSFTAAAPANTNGYQLTGYYTGATNGDKIINHDGTLVASTDYADGSGNWKYTDATCTLYPHYEAKTFSITYLDDDESTSISASPTSYTYGVGVAELPTPSKSGYRFVAWYNEWCVKEDEEGDLDPGWGYADKCITEEISTTDYGDATYIAKWVPLYTITNGEPANGTITVTSSAAAGDVVDIEATPSSGYVFDGWNIYKTGTPATTVSPAAATASTTFTMPAYAVTVSASFVEQTYTLSYALGGASGSASGGSSAGSYAEDATITTPAVGTLTKSGYTFRGWTDGTTFYLAGQTFSMPASNVTLTAVWEGASAGSYTYTFESSQPGNPLGTYFDITTSAVSGHTYEIASSLNSNNIKASDLVGGGSYFLGGTIGTSGVSATYKTKASYTNIDSIAFYENAGDNSKPSYVIKVVDASTGTAQYTSSTLDHKTIKGSNGTNTWTQRYRLDLHSSPKTGKIQIEVTSGSSGKYYALDNITVYYKGNDTNFDVSFNMKSHGDAVSSYVGVPNGKKILKPADPEASGYIFGGWYTDSGCTSAWDWGSSTVTKDTTLYAKWTAKTQPTQYTVSIDAATVCSGSSTNIKMASSQSGVSYQLYKGEDKVGDAKDGGSALTWSSISATGTYKVMAVENATYAAREMSNTVSLANYDAVSIKTDPTEEIAATVDAGSDMSVELNTGTFNNATYAWQTCTDATPSSASDISSGSQYANYNTATMTFTPAAEGTYYFRCKVTDDCGTTVYSNVATVTASVAKTDPTVYELSGTTSVCEGNEATLTLDGSDDGVTYALYLDGVDQSDDKVGDGNAITWTVTADGSYTVSAKADATYNAADMDGSAVISYKTATAIGTPPTAAVSGHDGVDFTLGSDLVATGEGTLTYQWYSYTSAEGAGPATVGSATTTKTLTTSKSAGTYYYKVEVIATCGSVKSEMITVTVDNKHRITYDANNGSGAPSGNWKSPGAMTLPTDLPTRSGYIFLGWNTKDDGTGDMYQPGGSFTMPSSATTLYAAWASPCFTFSKGTKNTEPTDGTVMTPENINSSAFKGGATLSGGNMTNTSGATLGINGSYGLVMIKSTRELTLTLTGGQFQAGTVIELEGYTNSNSTVHTYGFSVSGNAATPLKTATASSYDDVKQRYVVEAGDGVEGEESCTITMNADASGSQTYLSAIKIGGCMACTSIHPTLTYSKTTIWMDDASLTASPTLNKDGSTGSATYVSNNTDVATVNESTGVVTAVKRGTATITATIAADGTHCGKTATCDITVKSADCGYTEVAKLTRTSGSKGTISGPLAGNYGVNTQSDGKLGSNGHYMYLVLSSGHYYADGDSVYVTINKINDQGSYLTIRAGGKVPGADLAQLAKASLVVGANNGLRLSNVPANTDTITIYRKDGSDQNHQLDAITVKRYGCPDVYVYDNAAATDVWSDEDNWIGAAGHGSGLPTIDDRAIITKPITVDIAHATASEVRLDQSSTNTGSLTIQANKGLEVAGKVQVWNGSALSATTSSDLLLESSNDGNATLIFNNSNNCQATVQMYSKGWTTGEQGGGTWNWQTVGVPVTDATRMNDYYGGYMYEWSGGWVDKTDMYGALTPFTAYSVSYPTGDAEHLHTYSIDGTLVPTGDKEITIPANTSVMALANSWTAPIHISDIEFTSEPANIFLYNTGYNYESAATKADSRYAPGTYLCIPKNSAPYLDESYIAPMQGFYVKNKLSSAGTITINYDDVVRPSSDRAIVSGAMHAPKRTMSNLSEPAVLKMYVSDSQHDDRLVLLEREDFSRGFDNGWDGEKFQINAVKTAPRIFAINETGGKESVSAIPELENTVIGFRPGKEETYTIRFEYNGDETLYLRDTRTGAETLITNESEYVFLSDGTNEDARFIIVRVQSTPTGTEEIGAGSKAYKLMIEDHIYIIRDGRMYSVDGALVNLERK